MQGALEKRSMRRTRLLSAIIFPLLVTGSAFWITIQTTPPMALKASQMTLLTETNELRDAAFSPDGKNVVYSSNQSGSFEIWVMNSKGSHVARMTYIAGDAWLPKYSPDGQRVAFLVKTSQGTSLWLMDHDGSNQRNLTGYSAEKSHFSWNPNAQFIAYDSRDSQKWVVSVVDEQGNVRQLTSGDLDSRYPNWTPSGKQIIFSSGGSGYYNLWAMNVDGGALTRITSAPQDDSKPTVNPNGERIAFLSCSQGLWSLRMIGLDGSRPSDLLGNIFISAPTFSLEAEQNSSIAWNPDGKMLAFTTSVQGGVNYVVVLDVTSYLALDPSMTLPPPNRIIFGPGVTVNFAQLTKSGVTASISWSAAGTNLVMVSQDAGHWSIMNINWGSQKLRGAYGG